LSSTTPTNFKSSSEKFTLEQRFQCRNVDYKSQNEQTHSNLNLNVKGFASLEESLKDYMSMEAFDEEHGNQYDAEEHGKQDADRFMVFKSLPTALQIVLNRADFDFKTQATTKLTGRFTFPHSLDLAAVMDQERLELSGKQATETAVYKLFAMFIHAGQFQSGHYWSYIAPNPALDEWYTFNDNQVDPISRKAAMETAFGSEYVNFKL